MPGGIIISETEPNKENRYLWLKPSTMKSYELVDDSWVENGDLSAAIKALADLQIAAALVDGVDEELNPQKLEAMVFKKGILVKYA